LSIFIGIPMEIQQYNPQTSKLQKMSQFLDSLVPRKIPNVAFATVGKTAVYIY